MSKLSKLTPLLGMLIVLLLVGCRSTKAQIPKILGAVNIAPYGPQEVAVNTKTGYVYVLGGETRVAVLQDTKQIAFLPTLGDGAVSLAVDSDRDWVYVVNMYSDTVTVIQGTEVITTLETVGRDPRDVAVESASGLAYVVSPFRKNPPHGEIPVIEGNVTLISGPQIVGSIPLGNVLATDVIADPVDGYVYVSGLISGGEQDSDEVVVLKDRQIVGRFDIGPGIDAMDVNPHTGDVYVLNNAIDRDLTQFRAGQVIATLKIRPDDPNINSAFRTMRVHPVTGDLYAVDFVRHEAVVVRDMREIIGRAPVGLGPLKMTIDPVTENVYVANFRSDSVTVIHGTEVITTIETGWYPYGIGVNPTNGRVYVSNTNGDNIAILGVE